MYSSRNKVCSFHPVLPSWNEKCGRFWSLYLTSLDTCTWINILDEPYHMPLHTNICNPCLCVVTYVCISMSIFISSHDLAHVPMKCLKTKILFYFISWLDCFTLSYCTCHVAILAPLCELSKINIWFTCFLKSTSKHVSSFWVLTYLLCGPGAC